MMVLQVITGIMQTFRHVLQTAYPAFYNEHLFVEVGKVADPNAPIKFPSVYIYRSGIEVPEVVIGNLGATNRPYPPGGGAIDRYFTLYRTSIILQLNTESYMGWEERADRIVRLLGVIRRLVERRFKLHRLDNPSIGVPEVQERGNKVWVGQIVFPVMREIKWEQSMTPEQLEYLKSITLSLFDDLDKTEPDLRMDIQNS
jgi:hypothetical protein